VQAPRRRPTDTIIDPQWGHVTIKMSGHPPFPAQVILNGHEHVAARARAAGIGFAKEGNCFTEIADPQGLAQVADALPQPAAIGRLGQVCDRWIYTACLCFGLDLAEQGMSGFRYSYTVYQAEYSRNLLFRSGAQIEDLFDRIIDRTRSRLDIPALRTLFGLKNRPHHNRAAGPPAQEIVIENSQYGLTWFRIRFGLLQCKAYTKGEHVLRFEVTVHNTRELRCRRGIDNFPEIIHTRLRRHRLHRRRLPRRPAAALPARRHPHRRHRPQQAEDPRRAVGRAGPGRRAGFTIAEHAGKVATMTGQAGYTIRQAAYDLRKLRGKGLAVKPGKTRRYHIPPRAARTIAALLTIRDQVIGPILAGVRSPRLGRKPAVWTRVDRDYETLRIGMQTLFHDLGITPAAAAA